MKAVLVMDMPENCDICPFCNNCDYTCEVFQIHNEKYTYEVPSDCVKPDWCPLKPMPEKNDWKPSSGMRKTNAERIRSMTDEELATWIHNITTYLDGDDDEPMVSIYNLDSGKDEELYDSYGDIIEWLRKEADIPESNAGKWIPADNPPKPEEYVLLSFDNFSVPVVGMYREDEGGGAYYVGDDDESCNSHGLFVNSYMPLPEPYREE